ncbi:MAG: HAMP domain-containing sensor histidine kinase, partial [Ginsengibacter sp.]
ADTFMFDIPALMGHQAAYTSDNLFICNKITDNNDTLGTICIRTELAELKNIKNKQYEIAAVILVIGVGLAFLIALLVQPYISRRLLHLVGVMRQVGKTGDYTRQVNTDGKDEIAMLSNVFNNLMNQVRESQEKKDEFIGIASHELKTPLTSIKGYLQVLESIETKQPNKQYVQKSLDSVNRLQQLIFDLLDVSKIQSGQLHLNVTSFDIDALVDETIASFQIIAIDHQLTRKGAQLNLIVDADRQRIEQVLVNLLSNAVKYSPPDTNIYVISEKKENQLTIRVCDQGIGILKEEQPRVFDRFYRAKDNSVLISGFGLGLYICKDIMLRHKGKIWVESNGVGTKVSFSLPIQNN